MRTSHFDRERSNSCASNGSGGSTGGAVSNRPHSVRDIVKAGYLHIKRPPTNGTMKLRIKTWQKRYLVLRDESYDSGTARLDIFDTESGCQDDDVTSGVCYSVDLRGVVGVDEYADSKSHPNAFTVTRGGQAPLVLGADSEFEAKEWVVAIRLVAEKLRTDNRAAGGCHLARPDPARRPSCPPRLTHWNSASQLHTSDVANNNNNNDVGGGGKSRGRTNSQSNVRLLKLPSSISTSKNFLVMVHSTEAAKRNGLSGEYSMIVQGYDVILRRPNETSDVIKWSIGNIRKFKSEDLSDGWNLVTLDANVRCGSRSGMFMFRTIYGRNLIQKVKEALVQQGSNNQDPEKDLAKLSLNKAPSTPNLASRGSPPKTLTPKNKNPVSARERTQSNSEQAAKPNSYLQLLPEEPCNHSANAGGEYVDDEIVQEPLIESHRSRCVGTSMQPTKRLSSKLPPLPPPTISVAPPLPPPPASTLSHSSPPPPSTTTITSTTTTSSSSPPPSPTSETEPPELPPRRPSCTAPPPPPRPQHTLSTNSLPVPNVS